MASWCGIPKSLSLASTVMTETPTTTETEGALDSVDPSNDHIFLCVIDSTEEVRVAIRFARRKAPRVRPTPKTGESVSTRQSSCSIDITMLSSNGTERGMLSSQNDGK